MTLVTLHRHIRHCLTTSILGPQVCVCVGAIITSGEFAPQVSDSIWSGVNSVLMGFGLQLLHANSPPPPPPLWLFPFPQSVSFFLLFTFSYEERQVNLSFTYCTTGTEPNFTSDEVVKFKRMDFTPSLDGPWVTGVSGSERLKLTTVWQMKSWRLWRDSSIQWYVWLSAESLGVVKWQTGLVSADLTLTL